MASRFPFHRGISSPRSWLLCGGCGALGQSGTVPPPAEMQSAEPVWGGCPLGVLVPHGPATQVKGGQCGHP